MGRQRFRVKVHSEGSEAGSPFGTYQSRRVQTGGQRVEKTVGSVLEITKFYCAIKGAKNIGVKGASSKELVIR